MFTSFCLLNLNRSFRPDPTLFFSLCSRVSCFMIKNFFINTLANNKKRYKNKLRSDPSAHQKCLLVKTYPSIKVRSPAGWAVFQTSEAFLTRPAGSGLTRSLLPGRPPKGTTTSVCQYKGAVRTQAQTARDVQSRYHLRTSLSQSWRPEPDSISASVSAEVPPNLQAVSPSQTKVRSDSGAPQSPLSTLDNKSSTCQLFPCTPWELPELVDRSSLTSNESPS